MTSPRNQRTRHRAWSAILLAVLLAPQALAAATEPEPEPTPLPDGVPSFNESPGCGALDGIRGPTAEDPGRLEMWEPIYGPWGDFYGRTIAQAWEQRVVVQLPGMSPGTKALFIHQRVLPAFEQVVANLEAEAASGRTYTIYDDYTWSWAAYTIPPKRHFSFHAVGAAIDVNSNRNPYRGDNVLITNIPQWFAQAWRDAGWCWGGDWQEIKDTMHFAWQGPLFTPGYVMPPPQPPLVPAADFSAQVQLTVGLEADAGYPHVVADLDRDGAPDVVRIQPIPTGVALVTAAARYEFAKPQVLAVTSVPPTDVTAPVDLADLDRDGRPDLVYRLDDSGTVAFEVFSLTQSGALTPHPVTTAIPFDSEATYRFDDFNLDGYTDVFIVSNASPARLEVWLGPAFSEAHLQVDLDVNAARLDTGDRDVDGVPDLFVLDDSGLLTVFTGASGFTSTTTVATGLTGDEQLFIEDLDGDGHSDFMLVDAVGSTRLRRGGQSTHDPGVWYVVEPIDVGGSLGCIASDYHISDLTDSVGLVNRARGVWCLRGAAGELYSFYYGLPGDYPFMGDWDCDGIDTPGLYRQSNGFAYLRNTNTQGVADVTFFFGNPGDIPIAGDFDGDGCDTLSVYRPSQGRVFIMNELGQNGGNLGAADFSYYFGIPGDKPFVGDFDGDGIDTIGLHRESTGFVYFRNSHTQGPADTSFFFGEPRDRLVAGDWGIVDGIDTPAVFRPADTAFYFRHTNTQGPADDTIWLGESGWFPVAGSFG